MNDFPAFCLGPMAGFTDAAMRSVCLSMGAPIAYTEMVSARGLTEGNRNTKILLSHFENETRMIVQIFGHDPKVMAEACRILNGGARRRAFGVDINMGCPVPKVSRNGEGSALMGDPVLAGKIVESCVRASSVPISVKIRAGLRAGAINAPEVAKIAENSGAARVAVHGRTAAMAYRGQSDAEVIASVKDAVKVPVIGNGDVRSATDALFLKDRSGCDSVMIARGAVGNPFCSARSTRRFRPPRSRRLPLTASGSRPCLSRRGWRL